MSEIRIETKYSESIIEQATTSPMGDIVQRVIRLQDEGVRDALIALGWTPPGADRDRLASDLQATRAELEAHKAIESAVRTMISKKWLEGSLTAEEADVDDAVGELNKVRAALATMEPKA